VRRRQGRTAELRSCSGRRRRQLRNASLGRGINAPSFRPCGPSQIRRPLGRCRLTPAEPTELTAGYSTFSLATDIEVRAGDGDVFALWCL
jgi:hypothetical protein